MKNLLVLATVLVTAVGVGAEKKAAAKKAATKVKTEAKAAAPAATEAKPATAPAPAAGTSSAAPAAPATGTSSAAPTTSTTTSTSTEAVAAPSAAKILGEIDARPSWTSKTGEFHTENEVMLGYQFDKDMSLSYYQLFNTNLDDRTGSASGLGLYAYDGFARFKLNNVAKLGSAKVNYEARLHAPTYSSLRDAGMITTVRNYVKIIQDIGPVSINLSIVPIVHAFSKAEHKGKANPIFENRVYLIPTINFSEKLSLDLPVMFHQVLSRSAPGAKNSGDWKFILWTYPELTYTINPNLAVGAAYYSDNLLVGDKSALSGNFGNGLEAGVTQAFIRANL